MSIADRRHEPRIPASGLIEIFFEDPLPATIEAELQETSDRGFRILHGCQQLVPGLEVRMRRNGATQRARVMWTHLAEGRRVSGCLLL
jgi:hypothetical protein